MNDIMKGSLSLKKKKNITLVIITVILIAIISSIVDYNRIKKNESPIFCIKFSNGTTGKATYVGLGYKIIRYTGVSINEPFKSNIGVKFGSWFMNYKLDVIEEEINKTTEDMNDIDSFYNRSITENYQDIRNLDKTYSLEQATKDNCFVIALAKVYNESLYDSFMNHYKNKESSFIRVVQSTIEGDTMISDIFYDNKKDEIILVTDNTRNKFSDSENRTIKLSKYEKTTEYKYNNNLFWILYNGDIKDELFETDNVYVVGTIN